MSTPVENARSNHNSTDSASGSPPTNFDLEERLKWQASQIKSLQRELEALRVAAKAKPSNSSTSLAKEDELYSRAARELIKAVELNDFRTIRTIIPKESGFVGRRVISIPWDAVTDKSIVHAGCCEAVHPDSSNAPVDYVGIVGDANLRIHSAVCGNGVVFVELDIEWSSAISFLITVTLLGKPEQHIFASPDWIKVSRERATIKDRAMKFWANVGRTDGMSDEEYVMWAYKNILHREADPSGIKAYKTALANKSLTRDGIVKALRDSEEFRSKFG